MATGSNRPKAAGGDLQKAARSGHSVPRKTGAIQILLTVMLLCYVASIP